MSRRRAYVAYALLATVAASILFLIACSPTPPSRVPDLRGVVTTIEVSGTTGRILVEETPGETGDYKAWIAITDDTSLFRKVEGASPEPITIFDIAEGMQADAWFTGPVAESYPVQATGEAVLVSE